MAQNRISTLSNSHTCYRLPNTTVLFMAPASSYAVSGLTAFSGGVILYIRSIATPEPSGISTETAYTGPHPPVTVGTDAGLTAASCTKTAGQSTATKPSKKLSLEEIETIKHTVQGDDRVINRLAQYDPDYLNNALLASGDAQTAIEIVRMLRVTEMDQELESTRDLRKKVVDSLALHGLKISRTAHLWSDHLQVMRAMVAAGHSHGELPNEMRAWFLGQGWENMTPLDFAIHFDPYYD